MLNENGLGMNTPWYTLHRLAVNKELSLGVLIVVALVNKGLYMYNNDIMPHLLEGEIIVQAGNDKLTCNEKWPNV